MFDQSYDARSMLNVVHFLKQLYLYEKALHSQTALLPISFQNQIWMTVIMHILSFVLEISSLIFIYTDIMREGEGHMIED